MVDDVGGRLHHRTERLLAAVEVGDQHLNARVGCQSAELTNGGGKDRGATVGKIVAGDARYHHVVEVQRGECLGHTARLVEVKAIGATGLYGTEATGARAGVA